MLINVYTVSHKDTGLLIAMSDELKGLYVHGRTQQELEDRIPIAIRAILEADGKKVISVKKEAGSEPRPGGFLPTANSYQAQFAAAA